jgi:coenzyme F420 biosynthesis associated uncharacterized protein
VPGSAATVVAWEAGAVLGLVARAVLAQYDPFRDVLIVVYPNLGEVARGDGLKWLVFHEMTHLAQFRSAPWMPEHIASMGKRVMDVDSRFAREAVRRLAANLPQIYEWLKNSLSGKESDGPSESPLLMMLPPEQREIITHLNAMLTVLEGHATYITDRISGRVIPDYEGLLRRVRAQRKRPPLMRLLEALAGLDMKRKQYVLGRTFCESVWDAGGAEALAPFWRGPENVPTPGELENPEGWLRRVASSAAPSGSAS